MISQILDTAIVMLLVVLVTVPATVALARTLRQRVLWQRSERARRERRARSNGRPDERPATLVYRKLTASGQTDRR
ncbi:MAG: hypothetical protein OEU09_05780 [Rhodospirillales bacterium]|nr:hypothetical protein [Rhodospirillales bacterium]MDH3910788.1 hypothetical protein [Rhodospirillales bacterium]